jgi:hypothetical protein
MPTADEVRDETQAAIVAGGGPADVDLSYIDEDFIASLESYKELSDAELAAELERELARLGPEARLADGQEQAAAGVYGWHIAKQGHTVWYKTASYVWNGHKTAFLCWTTGAIRSATTTTYQGQCDGSGNAVYVIS